MSQPIRVVLCIVTYLRPEGLARLLRHIADLETGPIDAAVSVIVVDNDAEGSARPVVEAAQAAHGLDIVSVVEPTRGITFARNRALELARSSGAHWIGWIDDDEAPRSDWLQHILDTQRRSGADVVIGAAEPVFDDDAARWIVDAGVFHPPRFETGEHFPYFYTRTSGVIMRPSLVPDEGFDDRLALTGGEDRVFFTRIHRAGGVFVWDDRAVVDEWVPTSRVSVGWLVRRWFRTGVTRSLTLLYLDRPGPLRRARRVAGGAAMAARGVLETIWASLDGRGATLVASRRILLGVGASYGALGLHYREYRRTHGR